MRTEKSNYKEDREYKNQDNRETLTPDELAEEIRSLEGQDFFMTIPIGGVEHGR